MNIDAVILLSKTRSDAFHLSLEQHRSALQLADKPIQPTLHAARSVEVNFRSNRDLCFLKPTTARIYSLYTPVGRFATNRVDVIITWKQYRLQEPPAYGLRE